MHGQGEAVGTGEQPDGDLRLQPALLGEPGLAESVALIGLEVQGRDVVEHEGRPAQPGMRRARGGQLLPERLLRIDRQAPLERRIRRRRDTGFLQHPQRVELAGRLDDPRQHQLLEGLIAAAGPVKAQHPERMPQRVQQAAHPRRRDRQRPALRRRIQAQLQLALPGCQPLPGDRLQQLQLAIIVRRADVLDLPRSPMRGVHDLHRDRARRRLHRPEIRHPATLRPRISAHIRLHQTENMQVTASRHSRSPKLEPTQDNPPVLGSIPSRPAKSDLRERVY